jgi:hypothetical protein
VDGLCCSLGGLYHSLNLVAPYPDLLSGLDDSFKSSAKFNVRSEIYSRSSSAEPIVTSVRKV